MTKLRVRHFARLETWNTIAMSGPLNGLGDVEIRPMDATAPRSRTLLIAERPLNISRSARAAKQSAITDKSTTGMSDRPPATIFPA